MRRVDLAGAAHLELVSGVIRLRPEDAMGEAMLRGWRAQQTARGLRGGRFYQTAFFIPIVLSLALVGFMWQLIYSRDQGLINDITGGTTDWYGDQDVNLWAVLVAT